MARRNQIITTPENFVASLVQLCQEYTDEVKEKLENGLVKIGKEAVAEVKSLSPVYKGRNKKIVKGAYRDNWTYRTAKERGSFKVTVHVNGQRYRLTHLLENGHLNRDGTTRAKAIPHISIANDHAQKKVDKLLEDI